MQAIRSPVSWIRRRACVRHTERIRDAYIGINAVIDHALELSNTAVLSSLEEPTAVGSGAAVTDAILRNGVTVSGNAIVRRSLLLEHSAVDEHASVDSSIIGANTTITKGEVTASLVGAVRRLPPPEPAHLRLLAGGARAPCRLLRRDGGLEPQAGAPWTEEIWPGEGAFFGLGCAIRFPHRPQRIALPGGEHGHHHPAAEGALPLRPGQRQAGRAALDESAVAVPRAYNELIPALGGSPPTPMGWCAPRSNSPGPATASTRHCIDYKVLRPGIMRLVRDARERLLSVHGIKSVYLETDIDGIGKNFIREESRIKAIEVYGRALKRYCLRVLLAEQEGNLEIPGSAELAHELARQLLPGIGLNERMKLLIDMERANAELVQASKSRDDERGARIIPGYAEAHIPAERDPVVLSAWERVRRTEERVGKLGIIIRTPGTPA